MNIAIIGTGNVGGTLGRLWAGRGHTIVFGTRDPEKESVIAAVQAAGPNASATHIAPAVASAEVVVIAVPSDSVADVIADGRNWEGKIIVDATNRFTPPPPHSSGSAAGDLARLAVGARVVKAFNTIGANRYDSPRFGDQAASLFICGDDEQAKRVVGGLAEGLGFEVVDAGPLENADLLEAMAKLWVYLARSGMGRNHAFKLLRE
jgi:hypothetical protein